MWKRSAEIQRVAWAASQMASRELPYTVLRGLFIRAVLTTTNGGGAALTALQLAQIFSEIRIKINGSDTRVAISGEQLYIMNYYDYSKAPEASIDTGLGANRTQMIELYLPCALSRATRPVDTVLDLRKLPPLNPVSTAYMEITFPAATSIGTDITITSGYVTIQTVEYDGVGQTERPYQAIHEFSNILFPITATGVNRISLEVGGVNEYRRFFVLTKNAAGTLSNVQIDKIALRARQYTWLDVDANILRDWNAQDFSVTPLTGVYVIDTCSDGMMAERLDAKGLNELTIEPNALIASGTIYVLKEKAYYLPK